LDLDGDEGAAAVAPAVEGPEVVVQGPANFNIFHGESPPHLLEQDLPAERTPRVKQDPTTELIGAATLIRIHLIFSKILMFLPAVKMEEVCIPRQIGVFPGVHLRMCFGNCGSACLISSYPTVCTRNFPSRLAWSKNEI